MRSRYVLVLTAIAAVAGSVPAAATSHVVPCHPRTVNGWAVLPGPRFDVGPAMMTHLVAAPDDGAHLLATNGEAIAVSTDAGCTWRVTYRAEAPAHPTYGAAKREITRLHLPEYPGGRDIAFAASTITYPASTVAAPATVGLLRSTDDGKSWSVFGTLAAEGSLADVVSSPADINRLYALVAPAASTDPTGTGATVRGSTALWRTDDGGASWARVYGRGTPTRVGVGNVGVDVQDDPDGALARNSPLSRDRRRAVFTGFTRLAAHPKNVDEVWAYGPNGAAYSGDGGAWFALGVPAGDSVVDIEFSNGKQPRAWIARGSGNTIDSSATIFRERPEPDPDGFKTFHTTLEWVPSGFVDAIAVRGEDEMVLALSDAFYYHPPKFPIALPAAGPGDRILDVMDVPYHGGFVAVGRTATSVVRRSFDPLRARPNVPPPPAPPIPPIPSFDVDTLLEQDTALLHPRAIRREVPDSGLRQSYELRLPQRRLVDVFFLVDVSGSMGEEIAGLREGLATIVDTVAAQDVDAHFGVGVYRSYQWAPAYQRVRDIGPPDTTLRAALSALSPAGQAEETALTALDQIASGRGQDEWCTAPVTNNRYHAQVPPKQNVNFRPGALPIVLHVTDEPIVESACQPTLADAATGLAKSGIRHIGLGFDELVVSLPWYSTGVDSPRATLAQLSELTGAHAVSGVDCNGDGSVDIPPSAPLVCTLPANHAELSRLMATAISSALLAVRDVGTVDLRPVVASDLVGDVFPPYAAGIDLAARQTLRFDVAFTCAAVAPGAHRVVLAAFIRNLPIAAASAELSCPSGPGPRGGPVVVGAVAGASGGNNLPPPQPIPQPQPQAQAQAQAQAQGQSQAQGATQAGLAAQERDQPQLALAHGAAPQEEEFAMSRRDTGPPPELVMQWMIAAGLGAAVALRPRRRIQPARGLVSRNQPPNS